MRRQFAIVIACLSSANAFANISYAKCHVVDDKGTDLMSLEPLYPVRKSTLYRINEDMYIDLKYDAFQSSVTVTILRMPHYPWTFSEKVIGEDTLHLAHDASKEGVVYIGAVKPGAQLSCREVTD
jgi:hypothetical protein